MPDKCPDECPGNKSPYEQGGLCDRCPVLNCTGNDPLLDPTKYREDWAKEWKKWFNEGMIGYPDLYLLKPKEKLQ